MHIFRAVSMVMYLTKTALQQWYCKAWEEMVRPFPGWQQHATQQGGLV